MFCRVARKGVEARRVGVWRVVVLWRSLAINGTTWTLVARGLTSAISFAGSTGGGGVLVASVWTWWDGVGVAVVSPWNKGGEGGVRALFGLVAGTVQGTRGQGFGSERERRSRGTRLGVECVRPLYSTVSHCFHPRQRRRGARRNACKRSTFEF